MAYDNFFSAYKLDAIFTTRLKGVKQNVHNVPRILPGTQKSQHKVLAFFGSAVLNWCYPIRDTISPETFQGALLGKTQDEINQLTDIFVRYTR